MCCSPWQTEQETSDSACLLAFQSATMPGVTPVWQVTHSALMVHFFSMGKLAPTHSLYPPFNTTAFLNPSSLSWSASLALVDSVGQAQ
jgi:hypothetical protein